MSLGFDAISEFPISSVSGATLAQLSTTDTQDTAAVTAAIWTTAQLNATDAPDAVFIFVQNVTTAILVAIDGGDITQMMLGRPFTAQEQLDAIPILVRPRDQFVSTPSSQLSVYIQ